MEFKELKDKILKHLYPDGFKCIFCGEEIFDNSPYNSCDDCFMNLPRIEKFCERCGNPLTSNDMAQVCNSCKGKELFFEQAKAPFMYKDNIAVAIRKLKFENAKYLAKPLSYLIADEIYTLKYFPEIILPVPMFDKKKKLRGYNQCELLTSEVSKITNIPCSFDVLYKIKDTKEQSSLNFDKRQENLKNCFVVKNREIIKDKIVLIIDDVYTTGATVMELSKILLSEGARKVEVVTLAHTVLDNNK